MAKQTVILRTLAAAGLLATGIAIGIAIGAWLPHRAPASLCTLLLPATNLPGCTAECAQIPNSRDEATRWATNLGLVQDYEEGIATYYQVGPAGHECGVTQSVYRFRTSRVAAQRVEAVAGGFTSLSLGDLTPLPPEPLVSNGQRGYTAGAATELAAIRFYVGYLGDVVVILQVAGFAGPQGDHSDVQGTFDRVLPAMLDHIAGALQPAAEPPA